ncbi:MAG TPA: lysophospholipid acyltransferase family protein [Fibrobacteria bacterium]|nr:lysophospholipid acyltransferase family protein [Fibrobacteria bacterium]
MNRSGKGHPRRRGPVAAGAGLALLLLWSAAIAGLWLIRSIFLSPASRPVAAARFSRWWSLGALKLLGVRVEVHGPVPAPPFFLVANHLGYLDIAVIASRVPCTFVSKSEVAGWPVFGTLASLAGTLYVDRKSKRDAGRVSRLIPDHFAAGGSLTLFPEGTSTAGYEVAPFRSPLLEFPAATRYPVHCAALRYQAPKGFPPAALTMCWWGDATFLPHFLNLFRMPGMIAEIAFAAGPVSGADRKSLAKVLQEAVEERLGYLNGNQRGSRDAAGPGSGDPAASRVEEAMA